MTAQAQARIARLLAEKSTVSFEVFPPKTEGGLAKLYKTLGRLAELSPDFVTVTCGAGGGNIDHTVDIARHIAAELEIPSVAHTTCAWAGKTQIRAMLDDAREAGVDGVMALRGDPPKGQDTFVTPEDGFSHASDLVELIRSEGYPFSVGVAGYPEQHPESPSRAEDLRWLKYKVDKGADFVATQLFFDNQQYFDFVAAARDAGVAVPIVPGIMPIANYTKIVEFCDFCGTTIPAELRAVMEPIADDRDAVIEAGARWAADQVKDLLGGGAPGYHVYVLNQTRSVRRMLDLL